MMNPFQKLLGPTNKLAEFAEVQLKEIKALNAITLDIKTYTTVLSWVYKECQNALGSFLASKGKASKKNKLHPKFIHTFMIFISAYFSGFSLALNHTKGIITSASSSKIKSA